MKLYNIYLWLIIASFLGMAASCENDTTSIGSIIATGEVDITIDTLSYQLNAKAIAIESFDSKSGNLLIGSIQSKSYGKLDCSFVTRLMCSSNLGVPDSLFTPERVDSCKLLMGVVRDDITGDSLAPQKLTVYKLTEQLPSDINNLFNPESYYDKSDPFASVSYTVSEISSPDSAFYNNTFVGINVDLPLEFGKEIFEKYKEQPSIFEWPQTMAKEFLPGLFVKPTFGNGCVANIQSLYVAVFYHSLANVTSITDGDTIVKQTHVNNMAIPFTVSPEVLSSNNIKYVPSETIVQKNERDTEDGEIVLTTPGGYIGEFIFPALDLKKRYEKKNVHLSTVNDLILYIPGEAFDTSSGLGVSDNILMVKSSEYESFFEENKIPDNRSSFTGVYDASKGRYVFSSMRQYFLQLLSKDEITEEDITFTLVPVEIETETSGSYYSESTYVTKCVPNTSKPTMTLLKTNEAIVTFSFSTQIIK